MNNIKQKRKVNPRRRLILRLILCSGLLIIGFIIFLNNTSTHEGVYFVILDTEDEVQNLYLYDAVSDSILHRITNNDNENVIISEIASASNQSLITYRLTDNDQFSLIRFAQIMDGEHTVLTADFLDGSYSENHTWHPYGNYMVSTVSVDDLDANIDDSISIIDMTTYEYDNLLDFSNNLDNLYTPSLQYIWSDTDLYILSEVREHPYPSTVSSYHVLQEYDVINQVTEMIEIPVISGAQNPVFSPHINTIAYKDIHSLYTLHFFNIATQIEQEFSLNPVDPIRGDLLNVVPISWRPHHNQILLRLFYQSTSDGRVRPTLALLDLETGSIEYLSTTALLAQYDPHWLDNGTQLVFREGYGGSCCSSIIVRDMTTNEITRYPASFAIMHPINLSD